MKKKVTIISIICAVLLGLIIILAIFLKPSPENLVLKTDITVGVWWWHNDDEEKLLEFAKKNSVKEIYYYDNELDEDTYEFLKKAKAKKMKVYVLWDNAAWIDSTEGFDSQMTKYLNFQVAHQDANFEGVHLDVEPHPFRDALGNEIDRAERLQNYANMVDYITDTYEDVKFDFDIPFWFDDEVALDGETKELYKHVIDRADRVFVMSYRDTAEKVVSVARQELEYARLLEKQIAVSVEMKSSEGDQVSFREESKTVLYEEIKKLETLIEQDFLLSIHHIETWHDLKEK